MAVKITINDKMIKAKENMTILEAAEKNGIYIPTLCYMKELRPHARCRICIVEVEGSDRYELSCAMKVKDGMVIRTDTEAIRAERKQILEKIMAHHPVDCDHCLRIGSTKSEDLDRKICELCFFCDCVRDGFCELQQLNKEYKVDKLPYEPKPGNKPLDFSMYPIIVDHNKCIKCRRCIDVCMNVQGMHGMGHSEKKDESCKTDSSNASGHGHGCVRCGRCVDACPTGTMYMEESINKMLYDAHSYHTKTIGMASTSLLKELEKLYGMKEGTLDIHRVIAGLKKIGVDSVISEEQAIYESKREGEKILLDAQGPVIISNSFAVKNFVSLYYPDLADRISYYRSVQEAFAEIAGKRAEKCGYEPSALRTVVFTANNENGSQAKLAGTVDYSMNAREVYRLFKRTAVNPNRIIPTDALKFEDEPEFIFGNVTGPIQFNYEKYPEVLKVEGKTAAIAHNLGQAKALLDQVKEGKCQFDIIRLGA